MENLLDFLPALIFFWIIARAIRGAGRRRNAPGRPPQPGQAAPAPPSAGLSGFEELVRRLEQAAEAQNTRVAPALAPPALRPPAPAAALTPATDDFRFIGGLGEPFQETEFHETHPLSEKADLERMLSDGPPPRLQHPLARRLREVATAREAILLKDVLGPPRSRR